MMETFKEYYRFPLKSSAVPVKALTSDGRPAFDWLIPDYGGFMSIRRQVLVRLNGGNEGIGTVKKIYHCDNQVISATLCEGPNAGREIKLFRIRGWGMLTGSGGFHLPAGKAIEIQDAFAAYCVDMLNKCE